jgi:hypothetical protein
MSEHDFEVELCKVADFAEKTSIWRATPVKMEPKARLIQWQVYKVRNPKDDGWDIHFNGYTGHEGRVCSPVQEFNKETMTGRTRSGRIYELVGPPGYNGDAAYVWNRWIEIYGNPETECITEEYYDDVPT